MTTATLPHLREPDFLSREEHRELLDWALTNVARFSPAALVGRVVDPTIRNALSLRDLGPSGVRLKARIVAATPRWVAALRVTAFETSDIEMELVAHGDGAHFRLHSDTYRTAQASVGDRMLSAVYYFHREPKRFEGGYLRLHRLGAKPGDPGTDVLPEQNSLAVFPSWAPHEVLPVACPSQDFANSRFAVNCWVYRRRIS